MNFLGALCPFLTVRRICDLYAVDPGRDDLITLVRAIALPHNHKGRAPLTVNSKGEHVFEVRDGVPAVEGAICVAGPMRCTIVTPLLRGTPSTLLRSTA